MSETVKQVKPLTGVGAPIWENDTSVYPDLFKVAMEDSHVISYRIEVQQPEPRVMKCVDLIKSMKQLIRENSYGGHGKTGGYMPRHEKK